MLTHGIGQAGIKPSKSNYSDSFFTAKIPGAIGIWKLFQFSWTLLIIQRLFVIPAPPLNYCALRMKVNCLFSLFCSMYIIWTIGSKTLVIRGFWTFRCGRVVTDFLPYPKFRKSLLSWLRIQSGFVMFLIQPMCRASEAFWVGKKICDDPTVSSTYIKKWWCQIYFSL